MKLLIETEIPEDELLKLKLRNLNVLFPFATKVTLDYGGKTIYTDGKIVGKKEKVVVASFEYEHDDGDQIWSDVTTYYQNTEHLKKNMKMDIMRKLQLFLSPKKK